MPLLRDGQFIDDTWTYLEADDLPDEGKIIVDLAYYVEHKDALIRRNLSLGVKLPNDLDVSSLSEDLAQIDLILLDFPTFTDGRAYSQARHLRTDLGYKSHVRAVGNILADQLSFMAQCGVDEFEVDHDVPLEVCCAALSDMSLTYQQDFVHRSGNGPQTILDQRRNARTQRS